MMLFSFFLYSIGRKFYHINIKIFYSSSGLIWGWDVQDEIFCFICVVNNVFMYVCRQIKRGGWKRRGSIIIFFFKVFIYNKEKKHRGNKGKLEDPSVGK